MIPLNSLASPSSRQIAFEVLQVVAQGNYADVALHRRIGKLTDDRERALATELVYGCVRRQRTLDALIDCLGKKKACQQPLAMRQLLRLGFYQLRYLDAIPPSAAVNTTVELAKTNGLKRLSGVVNGILRQYLRQQENGCDPLIPPTDPVTALGIRYSFPDWIVRLWLGQLGPEETEQLCDWFNRPPYLDLRINPLRISLADVEDAFAARGIPLQRLAPCVNGLRLLEHVGGIPQLPGYAEGWWSIQDASAQLVAQLVAPRPGETIIDACAAPGGKATHLAELMGNAGMVIACDSAASRLKKVTANARRLGLTCIQTSVGDSRDRPAFHGTADRVLVDVPCSGLGTLHRHADARWRQSQASVATLTQLQFALLTEASRWLRPMGRLVYATCTLHPDENQGVIRRFLDQYPTWRIQPPFPDSPLFPFMETEGWLQVKPHRHDMDGFFMVALSQSNT